MHHTALTTLFLALAVILKPDVAVAQQPAEGKIRVLLTYGGHDFEEEPFFAMFDALSEIAYSKVEVHKAAGMFKPGLEKQFDVIVMYDIASGFTSEQQKAFVAPLNTGIGVVSLHHNLAASREWDEFRTIIGGAYLFEQRTIDGKKFGPSNWEEGQNIKVTVTDKQHPITAGIEDFHIHDEVYSNYYTEPDVKLLLTTDHPKNDHSLAWVKVYGKSRVFYLQLGHDATAWHHPNYPRILANGIRWAAER